jgi:hypothetical protein
MSFFLRQVNNVLNQLDDRVGTVAEEARILGSRESDDETVNDSGDDIEIDDNPDTEESNPFDDEIDFGDELSDEDEANEELNSNAASNEIQQNVGYEDIDVATTIINSDEDPFAEIPLAELQPDINQLAVEASSSSSISPAARNENDVDSVALCEKDGQSQMTEGYSDDSYEKIDNLLSTKDKRLQLHTMTNPIATTEPILKPPPSFTVSNQKLNDQQKEVILELKAALSTANSEISKMRKVNTSLERKLELSQAEVIKLQKQYNSLEKNLDVAEREIQAHLDELEQAGKTMEQERNDFKLEREELLEDHEEEMQKCKEVYEQRLLAKKENYENKIIALQERLTHEAQTRNDEQDEISVELESALSREKETLQKLIDLHGEKSNLESTVTKMELQQDALQKQVLMLSESSQTAVKAQLDAESKLDIISESHKRQIQQRQLRESELERMVADLGTALTVAQQDAANAIAMSTSKKNESQNAHDGSSLTSLQQKYDIMHEELESTKLQLSITTSQLTAIQKELEEVTKEQVKESAFVQNQIHDYEDKLQKLNEVNQKLELTVRDLGTTSKSGGMADTGLTQLTTQDSNSSDARIRALTHDLEQSRRKITSLSDQLIRQQGLSEQVKSEVIALKGRLQAATARADVAERQLADGGSLGDNISELESGRYSRQSTTTRRLKGGKNRFNQLPTRSMRKAIGLRQTALPGWQQQVGKTLDSIDAWMIETGGILRHEPLMRFAFGMYLCAIHIWCFVLVTFHTVEAERHDLSHIRGPLLKVAIKEH